MTGEAGEKFRAAAPPAGPGRVPGPPAPSPGSLPRWALGSPPDPSPAAGSTARGDPAPGRGAAAGRGPAAAPRSVTASRGSPPGRQLLTLPPPGLRHCLRKAAEGRWKRAKQWPRVTARRAGTKQTTRPRAVAYRGEGVGGAGGGRGADGGRDSVAASRPPGPADITVPSAATPSPLRTRFLQHGA